MTNKKAILSLLNPHLQNVHDFSEDYYVLKSVSPDQLFFNPNRFDLIIKYIYAKFYLEHYQTNWHTKIYSEHIAAFTNGTFQESDTYKNSLYEYLKTFKFLIKNFEERGFDKSKSILPIGTNNTIIDGAHRLALAYLFKSKITTVQLNKKCNYNYLFFEAQGLPKRTADYVAFTYASLNNACRIVNIFPSLSVDDATIKLILQEHGQIVYHTQIKFNEPAQEYLVRQMYLEEKWIGSQEDNYKNAAYRARQSFEGKSELSIYLYLPHNEQSAIGAKTKLRELANKGKSPIHINDTYKETLRLSKIYFNDNTIHFLNKRKSQYFENFYKLFDKYKAWINNLSLNKEDFCIDASAVLTIYGLREAADLDFLYAKGQIETGIKLVDCHNAHASHYNFTIDDIIYNPQNHFYFEGVKVAALHVIRDLKINRNELKDKVDVQLIDSLEYGALSIAQKTPYTSKNKFVNNISRRLSARWAKENLPRLIPVNSFMWRVLRSPYKLFRKIRPQKTGPVYFSQTMQDEYLDLNIFGGKKRGVFLDIGANDGITYSNTYYFEKSKKWKGICIEPIPATFKKLRENRRCHLVEGCISNNSGTKKFLKIEGYSEMLSGLVNNYDDKHLERIENELIQHGGRKEEIKVKTYTVNELTNQFRIYHIDYCSIDVEGSEFEILQAIDFERINIDVLTVENNYNDHELRSFMIDKGYRLLTRLGADDLYIKNNFKPKTK